MPIPAMQVLQATKSSVDFDPTTIAGLSSWLDASDTATITGSPLVTLWADKSGNGNDATNKGTTNYVGNGTRSINGMNVLDFSGLAGLTWFQPTSAVFTVFVVAASDVTGNQRIISTYDGAGGLTAGQIILDWLGTNAVRSLRQTVSTSKSDATQDTATHLFTAQSTTTSSLVRFDAAEATGAGYSTAPAVAYVIGQDTANTNFSWNGRIAEILYYESELSTAEIADVEAYLAEKWGFPIADPPPPPPLPTTFSGDEFIESFAFDGKLTAVSGPTLAVATPVKYASNPILPYVDVVDHDQGFSYVSVEKIGSTWHMLYLGAEIGVLPIRVHYASSTDGLTWTKPNIGRVTYDGNTDNNIVMDGVFTSGRWVPEISKWVVTTESLPGGGLNVYTADTPDGPYTLAVRVDPTGYDEGKEIFRRPDGTWVGFYVSGHDEDQRQLSAIKSDGTSLAALDAARYNFVIPATGSTDQKYSIGVERSGDGFVGMVMEYDSTDGLGTIAIDLWKSSDGLNWEMVTADFIPLGTSGAWDDQMIISGNRFAKDGNDWHVYYCGAAFGHDSPSSATERGIGRATFGAGRLFGYTGTGTVSTVVTDVLDETYTAFTLAVNVDAAGGSVDIELVDAVGDPISGFTAADFDTITTSVFDLEPTWGGLPAPQNADLRMVFTLTSATVHGYTITRT